jgi:signal transduction histidine kinase
MRYGFGTARRLAAGFGVLVLLIAGASAVALAGSARVHAGLEETRRREEGVRLSLELASAVRDQYAHQAHTIIIGDASHLGLYGEARETVARLTHALRQAAESPLERALVDHIEAESVRLDGIFRERIVPAVLRREQEGVKVEHGRAQLVVTRIQELTQDLVQRFEASIRDVRAETERVERRTRNGLIALLVAAPLVALAVSVLVGRSVAAPVARLEEGAARIAEGDLDARIEVSGAPELEALAERWNAMTASLKHHQEQLVQSEKLAGIGRLAAGVAHEINNPLGVILGYAKLMRKQAAAGPAEDLAVIEEETLRAKAIVEGLLDLSRPLPPTGERVDLRALSEDVVSRLREAHLLDGVAVTVVGDASAPGHPDKLRQVLVNLVRNAAEAAGEGGRISVAVAERDGSAEVAVEDSGPGVPPDLRPRLFEPFFTTKPSGTGLGLAVSLAIARAHGGDLSADAAAGSGARFALRLPRGAAAPAAGEAVG